MAFKISKAVTPEMVTEAKQKYPNTKMQIATLSTSDGEEIGEILVKAPSTFTQAEFEKNVDKNTLKSKTLLVNNCVVDKEQLAEINAWEKNSEEYAAAFDAAAQMLPVGKAVLKNV